MKVKEIMTKNIAYLNPMSTVVEAAQLMQKHNVGAIPVCDQSGVIGLVTDRDIVVRNIAHGKSPNDTPVKDVMTSQVTTISPETDVDDATKIMSQNQVRRLPVVENNMLVGILSLGDMAADSRFDTEASKALAEISIPAKPEKMPKK
ncbi:CBS domain-containing protein [Pseudobacteroides cellulosolvens]|uniref:Putative signal transduction protein with CBS domain containing protein n=1 Tax=Pseudobacteroides cellulosolvens ATCC 35603 = DSM 2933 TaxID=398512 RepID=A0A0L6JXV1_9FIRM|nr:CBS domain-containing protein [Pseudobacteroides cellulosolvens]KNY30385.1 putative signal transduction protein with CBS domain containing protein [Pseudobacteroides cellulosolvens ATCC 35603 = DSM 2933]